MADPHVKKITIYNLSNRIVFIEKDGNPILNNSIGFLPGEEKNIPTGSGTGNTTITRKDNLPGTSPKDHFYVDSKPKNIPINYSECTDAELLIVIKDDCVEPHYRFSSTDYTDSTIRYMGFHNSGAYVADFIVSYRSPGSSKWTDKKVDYFNAGRGTDKCSNQSDYPNKVYDLYKLNIPKGYEVTAKVNAQGGVGSGDNARSKAIFRYHPTSNRKAKYTCSGGSCTTKINSPSAENL